MIYLLSYSYLGGLRLASSSGTLRCASHDQMEALCQCDVTPERKMVTRKCQSACVLVYLSVRGVITSLGVLPRYSWQ